MLLSTLVRRVCSRMTIMHTEQRLTYTMATIYLTVIVERFQVRLHEYLLNACMRGEGKICEVNHFTSDIMIYLGGMEALFASSHKLQPLMETTEQECDGRKRTPHNDGRSCTSVHRSESPQGHRPE